MKKRTQDELYQILAFVRQRFEEQLIPSDLLIELYSSYQSVGDIALFIERSRTLFPKHNCGIASLFLQKTLGVGIIVRGRYAGQNHTFLQLDTGMILDCTADQFGGPKLYCGALKYPWSN